MIEFRQFFQHILQFIVQVLFPHDTHHIRIPLNISLQLSQHSLVRLSFHSVFICCNPLFFLPVIEVNYLQYLSLSQFPNRIGQDKRIIEQVMGQKRFLTYYLVCGIGAGLMQELVQYIHYLTIVPDLPTVDPDQLADALNMWNMVTSCGSAESLMESLISNLSDTAVLVEFQNSNLAVVISGSQKIIVLLIHIKVAASHTIDRSFI